MWFKICCLSLLRSSVTKRSHVFFYYSTVQLPNILYPSRDVELSIMKCGFCTFFISHDSNSGIVSPCEFLCKSSGRNVVLETHLLSQELLQKQCWVLCQVSLLCWSVDRWCAIQDTVVKLYRCVIEIILLCLKVGREWGRSSLILWPWPNLALWLIWSFHKMVYSIIYIDNYPLQEEYFR